MKEIYKAGAALFAVTALIELSQLAFSRPQRLRMGSLKGWECEKEGCGRKYRDGWMLEFNHKTPVAEGGQDTEENAELLCLRDHYNFHKNRGDRAAARLIYDRIQKSKGGHTWDWLKKNKR